MKVVITGGLGFLGLGIARALVRTGEICGRPIDAITLFDARVPDQLPDGLDAGGFEGRVAMVAGDVADADQVRALIDRDDVSVFHLASVVSAGGELDFDLALRVNLTGGRNVFEALRARKGRPRVVFASSLPKQDVLKSSFFSNQAQTQV